MSAAELVAALDLGTTALKGVVISRDGQHRAEASVPLEVSRPHPGWMEQDPQAWWDALREVCAQWAQAGVDLGQLRAMSLSGQMQDVILTRAGAATHPALLYADTRASAQAADISARLALDVAQATGNPYSAGSILPKLVWLSQHVPRSLSGQPRLHVGAKDYLIERLCGAHVTDHTTAATTGLYDLERGRWWTTWPAALGLEVALPELRWPHELAGHLHGDAAAELGLPPGLAILTGIGDAGATTLGAGAAHPGERHLYLGTSGWLGAVTGPSPGPPDLFRLPLLSPAERLAVAPLTNLGSAHRWAADIFAAGDFAVLERLLERSPTTEVLCLPYFAGERFPVDDPQARGVFVGIGPTTGAGELARAVLEGVAYALRATSNLFGGTQAQAISVLGGASRSAAWCQIVADVFGSEVILPQQAEVLPALGGAYPAFRHLGWVSSFEAYRALVLAPQTAARFLPRSADVQHHDRQFARFLQLYPAVRGLF